jgi:hypothetical protein
MTLFILQSGEFIKTEFSRTGFRKWKALHIIAVMQRSKTLKDLHNGDTCGFHKL